MDKINNIFGIKNKPTVELRTPERQSIEQTEDYAVKKVVNTQEGTVEKVPVNDNDIVNKLYCDNNGGGGGGAPEGTAVKSTGEVVGLVLTSNGDDTSSWTAPSGGNPFDQDLNTTNDVEFKSVAINFSYPPETYQYVINEAFGIGSIYNSDITGIGERYEFSLFPDSGITTSYYDNYDFDTQSIDHIANLYIDTFHIELNDNYNYTGTWFQVSDSSFTYKGNNVLTDASATLQVVTDAGNTSTNDLSVERSESAGYVVFSARNTADDGHTEFMLGNDESPYAGFVAMAGSATGAAFYFDIGTGSNCGIGFWVNNLRQVVIDNNGQLGIGTDAPTSPLQIINIPSYADNAAAITGGLTVGAVYRTGDILKIVH